MTILETERLTLRKLTTEDAAFVLEMLNDPAFIRNVADRGVRTIADATAYIEQKHLPQYAQFGFGFYLMELKGGFLPIGMCGLMKRETRDDVDIGYSVLERFAGRGYAFEAASPCCTMDARCCASRVSSGLPRRITLSVFGSWKNSACATPAWWICRATMGRASSLRRRSSSGCVCA